MTPNSTFPSSRLGYRVDQNVIAPPVSRSIKGVPDTSMNFSAADKALAFKLSIAESRAWDPSMTQICCTRILKAS